MRGRKSSRGAAVVLAGCVGLALVAPGLAFAQETTPATCLPGQESTVLVPCTTATGGTATVPTAKTATPTAGSPEPEVPAAPGADATAPGAAGSTSPSAEVPAPGAVASPAAEAPAAAAAPSKTSTSKVAATSPQGVSALNGVIADATDTSAVTDLLGLPLPGLPTTLPTPDPTTGDFANINDECLASLGGLQSPAGTDLTQLGALSTQLQGFCSALDPTALTDLIKDLTDLLTGLIPSLPGAGGVGSGVIPTAAPAGTPDYYSHYWTKGYDVNCGDVTYNEAQAILSYDRSDPNNLDGDDDGIACEGNARIVNATNYGGYPQGGVSTGDGSTGASPAGVAQAAMALSALALGGVLLVRRFGEGV